MRRFADLLTAYPALVLMVSLGYEKVNTNQNPLAIRVSYGLVLRARIEDIPGIQKLLLDDGRASISYQRVSGSRLTVIEADPPLAKQGSG